MSDAKDQGWSIGRNNGGYHLSINKTPLLWSIVGDLWWGIQEVTDHALCCKIPDPLWDIPLSEETYEDGKPVDSVGSRIMDLSWKLEEFLDKTTEHVLDIGITKEEAARLAPDFFAIWEDDDND